MVLINLFLSLQLRKNINFLKANVEQYFKQKLNALIQFIFVHVIKLIASKVTNLIKWPGCSPDVNQIEH